MKFSGLCLHSREKKEDLPRHPVLYRSKKDQTWFPEVSADHFIPSSQPDLSTALLGEEQPRRPATPKHAFGKTAAPGHLCKTPCWAILSRFRVPIPLAKLLSSVFHSCSLVTLQRFISCSCGVQVALGGATPHRWDLGGEEEEHPLWRFHMSCDRTATAQLCQAEGGNYCFGSPPHAFINWPGLTRPAGFNPARAQQTDYLSPLSNMNSRLASFKI